MASGYVEFEFDLPGALLSRLVDVFDEMDSAPLIPNSLQNVTEEQGVYQLFLAESLVYIGKTDAEAGLAKRLGRHCAKLQHRIGLEPSQVFFKAVRLYVFTAVDLETQLIRHYGGTKAVSWNGSGFGSNDPGRERDTSSYKDAHFDTNFPIDIDRAINLDFSQFATAFEVLSALKSLLPYTFRFETAKPRSRKPHPELEMTKLVISKTTSLTTRNIIAEVVGQLSPGWQAIKLPSHVILYKNDNRSFPQGTIIARSE